MAWCLIEHTDKFTFIFTADTEATERSSVDQPLSVPPKLLNLPLHLSNSYLHTYVGSDDHR
jgi:hypothetical protein